MTLRPNHSYLKMLYKYPQAAYPYSRLVEENRNRGLQDNEFELIDTGVFDENRYWDVFVEYFKAGPDDILAQITIYNRGPEAAKLHVLPQLWFRNTWSWNPPMAKPEISAQGSVIAANHPQLGTYYLYTEDHAELLFCENETNVARLYGAASQGYYKDAFHEYLVHGNRSAVNPLRRGSKACVHLNARVGAGASARFRLRLSHAENPAPFADFDQIANARKSDCDDFYFRNSNRPGARRRSPGPTAGLCRNDMEQTILRI